MENLKHYLTLCLFLLLPFAITAQSDCDQLVWPEDEALNDQARTQLALYSDALKGGHYKKASVAHRWFLVNHPEFNKSIYINGAKIFNELADLAESQEQKMVYVDSLMIVYDMRKEYCNNEKEVVARKAYDSYRHTVRNQDRLELNLELFDEAFELNEGDIPSYMILPYMNLIKLNNQINKKLSLDEVIERYDLIQLALDKHESEEGTDKLRSTVDGIYIEILGGESLDCETIKQKLGPKFKADPTNVKLAKQLFSFMLKAKCTEDPLWLEAGEVLGNSPEGQSFGLFMALGKRALANNDVPRAERLVNRAMDFSKSGQEKAEAYMLLGSVEADKGNKSSARSLYYKAAEADPSAKEPYSAIGYLYFNSFDQCKQEQNRVKDRLVYLAAYDMFNKGGNAEMAARSKEQFPSKVEIFEQNYEVGKSMNTGCWMNEDVTLRTRD